MSIHRSMYNPFLVYCRELAPGTVSLTGDRAQGDDSKYYSHYTVFHTQGAEVTGQLRVNGIVRHLRRCTLEDQSLALKRKHRVHKYVNTATICVSVMTLFILT